MPSIERPALGAVDMRDRLLLWSRRFDRRRVMAVILAALVAFGLFVVVGRARATVAELGHRLPVVVARRDLAPGEILVTADVQTALWPVDLVPLASIAPAPEGRIVREPIVAGEVVIEQRLFAADSLVGPGERQVTLPQPLAPPPVAVGDHVELYGMLPPEGPFATAPRLITSAVVVTFDEVGVSVAVPNWAVAEIIEFLVLGVIEIVQAP